jgi:hypothetical protein
MSIRDDLSWELADLGAALDRLGDREESCAKAEAAILAGDKKAEAAARKELKAIDEEQRRIKLEIERIKKAIAELPDRRKPENVKKPPLLN